MAKEVLLESIPLSTMNQERELNDDDEATLVENGGQEAAECLNNLEKSRRLNIQGKNWQDWIFSEKLALKQELALIGNISQPALIVPSTLRFHMNLLQIAVIKGSASIVESILSQAGNIFLMPDLFCFNRWRCQSRTFA